MAKNTQISIVTKPEKKCRKLNWEIFLKDKKLVEMKNIFDIVWIMLDVLNHKLN